MELARDFLLHLNSVRECQILTIFLIILYVTIFSHLKENICDNALNLANGLHIVGNWPDGTYCQWLISAQDDDSYVTLEIQNLHVKLT